MDVLPPVRVAQKSFVSKYLLHTLKFILLALSYHCSSLYPETDVAVDFSRQLYLLQIIPGIRILEIFVFTLQNPVLLRLLLHVLPSVP